MQAPTSRATSAESVTSPVAISQVPPSSWMIAYVSRAAASLMSTPKMRAPWRAKRTAIDLPLPQPGPT
nr:hypothetical protein [uncultured Roseococcus sp.]